MAGKDRISFRLSLKSLAERLIQEHGDHFLKDLIRAPFSADGAKALSRAIVYDEGSDRDAGSRSALEAGVAFRKVNNRPGGLRAEEEALYAFSRMFRTRECLNVAAALDRDLRDMPYPWIRIQLLLARSTCLGRLGDLGASRSLKQQAVELADRHQYKILLLRAQGLLASWSTEVGDLQFARRQDYAGLSQYWRGSFPALRAYQFYDDWGEIALRSAEFDAGYLIERQAVKAIEQTHVATTEAMARYRLATFAGLTGRTTEAEAETARADRLILQSEGAERSRIFRAEKSVAMARAWLDNGRRDLAAIIANRVELPEQSEKASAVNSQLAEVSRLTLKGTLALQDGRRGEAEKHLTAADNIVAHSLATVPLSLNRAHWQKGSTDLYRLLVSLLTSAGKTREALALWERYRNFSSRTIPSRDDATPEMERRIQGLRHTTVLSFVQQEDRIIGWLADNRGILSFESKLGNRQAAALCGEFTRLASRADSDLVRLRSVGRGLYSALIAPVAERIDPNRTLFVEPDGPCSGLAFEALPVPTGGYLIDITAVGTSPGIFSATSARQALNADSPALVVGDPRVSGIMATGYPELPDARREAALVAQRFHKPITLTGTAATEIAVSKALTSAELFHFAGHGVTNSDGGALLLAASNDSGAAWLDSALIEPLLRRCRLAVLSACNSANGQSGGVFNPDSLIQALWRAGVPDIIATRWPIESKAATLMTDSFYDCLDRKMDPVIALRQAALKLRHDNTLNHPAHWAGFHAFSTSILK